MLSPNVIAEAHQRIAPYIHRTPLLHSSFLDTWLGHRIYFKMENLQKIGAFKIRGALNALLAAKEQGTLTENIVAFSSGNHAQAVACAAKMLGVKAKIFLPEVTSAIKIQATRGYGAEVVLTPTRQFAEALVEDERKKGATFIHPYDNDYVLAGQGTSAFEALQDGPGFDAVFAPIGGGGLISGTYLATQLLSPETKVIACEPLAANDAAQSLRDKKIFKFGAMPNSIADGVNTLSISERTFAYLQNIDSLIELDEEDIIRWTQFLSHLLKAVIEPTSAMAMSGAQQWLATQKEPKTVLVIISAGNVAPGTHLKAWHHNYLNELPLLAGSHIA